MKLNKIEILLITICVLFCISTKGKRRAVPTAIQSSKITYSDGKDKDNLMNELRGCWHPILYTISDVYARDTNDIKEIMKKEIYIGFDTAVIFTDTIFHFKIADIEQANKSDWIFNNIDADKRKIYNILGSKVWDVMLDCRMRSAKGSTIFYRTIANFDYDGRYLFYSMDGFNFLLERCPG